MPKKKIVNRQKEVKLRKNVFPAIVLTIIFWFLLAFTVLAIPPTNSFAVLLFFILSFLSIFFTGSLLLGNSRRGLLLSGAVVIFLFLRYLGIGNFINFILIFALAIILEIYISST